MNIITWHAAYCLFPQATLENRQALRRRYGESDEPPPASKKAIYKYTERGYHVSPSATSPDSDGLFFPEGACQFGDRRCWTVPLDCTNLDITGTSARANWDPVQASIFTLTDRVGGNVVLSDNRFVVQGPMLRYAHLMVLRQLESLFRQLCDMHKIPLHVSQAASRAATMPRKSVTVTGASNFYHRLMYFHFSLGGGITSFHGFSGCFWREASTIRHWMKLCLVPKRCRKTDDATTPLEALELVTHKRAQPAEIMTLPNF